MPETQVSTSVDTPPPGLRPPELRLPEPELIRPDKLWIPPQDWHRMVPPEDVDTQLMTAVIRTTKTPYHEAETFVLREYDGEDFGTYIDPRECFTVTCVQSTVSGFPIRVLFMRYTSGNTKHAAVSFEYGDITAGPSAMRVNIQYGAYSVRITGDWNLTGQTAQHYMFARWRLTSWGLPENWPFPLTPLSTLQNENLMGQFDATFGNTYAPKTGVSSQVIPVYGGNTFTYQPMGLAGGRADMGPASEDTTLGLLCNSAGWWYATQNTTAWQQFTNMVEGCNTYPFFWRDKNTHAQWNRVGGNEPDYNWGANPPGYPGHQPHVSPYTLCVSCTLNGPTGAVIPQGFQCKSSAGTLWAVTGITGVVGNVASMGWSSANGGQVNVVMAAPSVVVVVGQPINSITGATNTGTAGVGSINGAHGYTVNTWTDSQHFSFLLPGTAGQYDATFGGTITLTASGHMFDSTGTWTGVTINADDPPFAHTIPSPYLPLTNGEVSTTFQVNNTGKVGQGTPYSIPGVSVQFNTTAGGSFEGIDNINPVTSHMVNIPYALAILTRDPYTIETCHALATNNDIGIGFLKDGVTWATTLDTNGNWLYVSEVRGIAWKIRDLAQAVLITPTSPPSWMLPRAAFKYTLDVYHTAMMYRVNHPPAGGLTPFAPFYALWTQATNPVHNFFCNNGGIAMYQEDYLQLALLRAMVADPTWVDYATYHVQARAQWTSSTNGWCNGIPTMYGNPGFFGYGPIVNNNATGGPFANYSDAWNDPTTGWRVTYQSAPPRGPGGAPYANMATCPNNVITYPGGTFGSYYASLYSFVCFAKQTGLFDQIPGFNAYYTYVSQGVKNALVNQHAMLDGWRQAAYAP